MPKQRGMVRSVKSYESKYDADFRILQEGGKTKGVLINYKLLHSLIFGVGIKNAAKEHVKSLRGHKRPRWSVGFSDSKRPDILSVILLI